MEKKGKVSVTPLSVEWLSLHLFTENSQALNGITWKFHDGILPKQVNKYG